MRRRHNRKQNYTLTYLFILAFGSTILYSFSLMHEVTGFAAASDTPLQCQSFAGENDVYCDDAKENCADKYVEGTSLAACHECTTGAWKQLKWCNKYSR